MPISGKLTFEQCFSFLLGLHPPPPLNSLTLYLYFLFLPLPLSLYLSLSLACIVFSYRIECKLKTQSEQINQVRLLLALIDVTSCPAIETASAEERGGERKEEKGKKREREREGVQVRGRQNMASLAHILLCFAYIKQTLLHHCALSLSLPLPSLTASLSFSLCHYLLLFKIALLRI